MPWQHFRKVIALFFFWLKTMRCKSSSSRFYYAKKRKELRFGMQWQSSRKIVKTFKSNLQRSNFAKNRGNGKKHSRTHPDFSKYVLDSIFQYQFFDLFCPGEMHIIRNRNWLCTFSFLKNWEVITGIIWHVICIFSKVILQI